MENLENWSISIDGRESSMKYYQRTFGQMVHICFDIDSNEMKLSNGDKSWTITKKNGTTFIIPDKISF